MSATPNMTEVLQIAEKIAEQKGYVTESDLAIALGCSRVIAKECMERLVREPDWEDNPGATRPDGWELVTEPILLPQNAEQSDSGVVEDLGPPIDVSNRPFFYDPEPTREPMTEEDWKRLIPPPFNG